MEEEFEQADAEHPHHEEHEEEPLHNERPEEMAAEQEAAPLPEGESTPIELADLAVTLMFEVGEQTMTAAEIQGLHNGYTFLLDNPIEQPVKLRANGKLIGECQLVEIEGRLGARISRLNN